jgi:hypothetical protein
MKGNYVAIVAATVLALGAGSVVGYNLTNAPSDSSSTIQVAPSTVPDTSSTQVEDEPTPPIYDTEEIPESSPAAQPTTTASIDLSECLSKETANRLIMEAFDGEGPSPFTKIDCMDKHWAIGTAEGVDGQSLFFRSDKRGWFHYQTGSYWADDEDTCNAVGEKVGKRLSCPQYK